MHSIDLMRVVDGLIRTVGTKASDDPRKIFALIVSGVALIAMSAYGAFTAMSTLKLTVGAFSLLSGIVARQVKQYNLDNPSTALKTDLVKQSSTLQEPVTPSPTEVTIAEICQSWMTSFIQDFRPEEVQTYTFDRLYREDVQNIPEERKAIQQVFTSLWGITDTWDAEPEYERVHPHKKFHNWKSSILPEGWSIHSSSCHSLNIENPEYPGYIFKYATNFSNTSLENNAASFLRVPKGKELRGIIQEDHLDELEVVEEILIALKPKSRIQKTHEVDQAFYFVVKSKKIHFLDSQQAIDQLKSYDEQKQIKIANQIAQLICKSGINDIKFNSNIVIDEVTGKLVIIDTEPLGVGPFLHEQPSFTGQYYINDMARSDTPKWKSVDLGLMYMAKEFTGVEVPIFAKVATAYRKALRQQYPQLSFEPIDPKR
jgi:hypothetical protein